MNLVTPVALNIGSVWCKGESRGLFIGAVDNLSAPKKVAFGVKTFAQKKLHFMKQRNKLDLWRW